MVRDTGLEPVTPSVSGRCSTTELTARESGEAQETDHPPGVKPETWRGRANAALYAAILLASRRPRIRTVCLSCSSLSGFFKTVTGPFAKMRLSMALSG